MEDVILNDTAKSPNLDDYMLQKKLEIMIDINNKKISAELNGMRSVISKFNEELAEIKKSLNGNAQRLKEPAVSLNTSANDSRQSDFRRTGNSEQQMAKPRTGDYEPKDVSIDKFFYFGNKTK